MPSTDNVFTESERKQLLNVAAVSIRHGLKSGQPLLPALNEYPASLQVQRASFVTLRIDDDLRGCIGSLEAYQPLVMDVAHNAFAAAFRDPRFTPLKEIEFPALEIQISVLSPPTPLHFSDETDLLRQLRPGVDGLILTAQGHRGTFLPSVWESLPRPKDFLSELKRKAGLAENFWSRDVEVQRYTTESFSDTGKTG
ncbi:MAG: AmmeMemoRadiSam system protein A [Gammaproteobacteria bacterium]|nr:AmmeMemoRadiSam system protein A [Gammaproteobacteria bacterium]